MTDAELLKSVGLYYSKIAQHMGVSQGTVKNWACYGIPEEQRQAVMDLKEAVRQVIEERKNEC